MGLESQLPHFLNQKKHTPAHFLEVLGASSVTVHVYVLGKLKHYVRYWLCHLYFKGRERTNVQQLQYREAKCPRQRKNFLPIIPIQTSLAKDWALKGFEQEPNDYLSESLDEEVGSDDFHGRSTYNICQCQELLEQNLSLRKGVSFPFKYVYPNIKGALDYSEKLRQMAQKREKELNMITCRNKHVSHHLFTSVIQSFSPQWLTYFWMGIYLLDTLGSEASKFF